MQIIASNSVDFGILHGVAIWFFILAMITFAGSIALRSFTIFIGQLILFLGCLFIPLNNSASFFLVIQALLSLYLIYRIQQAIKYNYDLIREKTHLQARNITTKSYTGTKFTF